MRNTTDFHPLILPHLDGQREGQWCTFSADDGMIYLLNGDRCAVVDIGKVRNFAKEIHFVSEDECHRQASEYYTRYSQTYPYYKEWSAGDDAVKVAESQVMKFI